MWHVHSGGVCITLINSHNPVCKEVKPASLPASSRMSVELNEPDWYFAGQLHWYVFSISMRANTAVTRGKICLRFDHYTSRSAALDKAFRWPTEMLVCERHTFAIKFAIQYLSYLFQKHDYSCTKSPFAHSNNSHIVTEQRCILYGK